MPISQHVRFEGQADPDEEFRDPPGASIIRALKNSLSKCGWQATEMDNWRDCGWSFNCYRSSSNAEIVLCQTVEPEWYLMITPIYVPGFIGRWRGKKVSATAAEVYSLAKEVHQYLSRHGFSFLKWIWDDDPYKNPNAHPEPPEPEKSS